MYHLLLVAIGGALGSALRHLASLLAMRLFGPAFPWGTMVVNIVGGFIMGLFIEMLARRFGGSTELRLLVATGILGGFTTFSAFSLDAVTLYERGLLAHAAAYVLASVVFSIMALFLGMWLAKSLA